MKLWIARESKRLNNSLVMYVDKKPEKLVAKGYWTKAIDVYQGKTTLEITYRDGVPVDSVVIFKKK